MSLFNQERSRKFDFWRAFLLYVDCLFPEPQLGISAYEALLLISHLKMQVGHCDVMADGRAGQTDSFG